MTLGELTPWLSEAKLKGQLSITNNPAEMFVPKGFTRGATASCCCCLCSQILQLNVKVYEMASGSWDTLKLNFQHFCDILSFYFQNITSFEAMLFVAFYALISSYIIHYFLQVTEHSHH